MPTKCNGKAPTVSTPCCGRLCQSHFSPPSLAGKWLPNVSITRCNRHICSVTDPSIMQDVIVGGAIVSAVVAALVSGIQREPTLCESCAGSGGVRCFACEGTGKMSGIALEQLAAAASKRNSLGRSSSSRECKACLGNGLLFCKRCSGTGYSTKRRI